MKSFKANFIKYLTNKFVDKAVIVTHMYPLQLIVDSPSSSTLLHICDGNVNQHPPNNQGEADYAIWHHATHAPSSNVLVVSSDTDSWVYGLGILEIGWLRGKTVYVKRSSASIPVFVNINSLVSAITTHEQFGKLVNPASSIVALYVLTGCDYVSSFYRCTKANFVATLLQNIEFVFQQCRSLVTIEEDTRIKINIDPWMRLVTTVYYNKHKTFFRSKPIQTTYQNIIKFPDSSESQRIFNNWLPRYT